MEQTKSITQLLTRMNADRRDSGSISSESSTLPIRSKTSAKIIELRSRFGDNPGNILAQFAPDKQVQYCREVDRCYFGKAPSVAIMAKTYGREIAESWLEIQLQNLSEFAGCKEKIKSHQITELAAMMIERYGYYKLTEFMLFFQKFKRGEYGKFYGAVDPMLIMQALDDFQRERVSAYTRKENQEERAKRQREEREWDELQQRYRDRVPDAFTEAAPLSFTQYRLLGYDFMDDKTLNNEIKAILSGEKTVTDVIKDGTNRTLQRPLSEFQGLRNT